MTQFTLHFLELRPDPNQLLTIAEAIAGNGNPRLAKRVAATLETVGLYRLRPLPSGARAQQQP
jgi:hypothetical protein